MGARLVSLVPSPGKQGRVPAKGQILSMPPFPACCATSRDPPHRPLHARPRTQHTGPSTHERLARSPAGRQHGPGPAPTARRRGRERTTTKHLQPGVGGALLPQPGAPSAEPHWPCPRKCGPSAPADPARSTHGAPGPGLQVLLRCTRGMHPQPRPGDGRVGQQVAQSTALTRAPVATQPHPWGSDRGVLSQSWGLGLHCLASLSLAGRTPLPPEPTGGAQSPAPLPCSPPPGGSQTPGGHPNGAGRPQSRREDSSPGAHGRHVGSSLHCSRPFPSRRGGPGGSLLPSGRHPHAV